LQWILDTLAADFNADAIPNETESFGHEIVAFNQSECINDYFSHLSRDDEALIDSVIADIGIDFNDLGVLSYFNPDDLDTLADGGVDNLVDVMHSGLVSLEENQQLSEQNARNMVAEPVHQLNPLLQLQSEIEQQKERSQLLEEISHFTQVNLQLQEELNRYKAAQREPQQPQVSSIIICRLIHS